MLVEIRKIYSRYLFIWAGILALSAGVWAVGLEDQQLEAKVDEYLSKMTLQQKLDYIGGYKDFYIRPVESLELPAVKMADGPIGVRNYGRSTQYPACIMLAASWNPDLAGQYGVSLGRDCRARGVHILLAPGVNTYRAPMCGRNFEYAGEDPVLSSSMVEPLIKGIQSQGVLATVKHFAGNNLEYGRNFVSSNIDERTLREIYLPVFKTAVQKAKVGCVMCAYNLLNGTWCSANKWLNVDILKGEWGFDGILMSDWGAVHEIMDVANYGVDLEMPSGHYLNKENLEIMLRAGVVSQAAIDDKVRRILRTIIRAGFIGREQKLDYPLDDPASADVALNIAREGIVMLKNEKNVLPFDPAKVKTVVVAGPFGGEVPEGGGSSKVEPFSEISTVDGIKDLLGDSVQVLYFPVFGKDVIAKVIGKSVYSHQNDTGELAAGLTAEYYAGKDLAGAPIKTSIVDGINFSSTNDLKAAGLPQEYISARWSGYIIPKATETYDLAACSDDGFRLWLDGELVIDMWGDHAAATVVKSLKLEADKSYKLKVEYYQGGGDAAAMFGWGKSDNSMDIAVQAAEKADAVIVCAGLGSDLEGEGADRPFALPAEQNNLIREMIHVNKNTAVVIHAGGSVDMSSWIGGVNALLMAWYPGQQGGQAIAEVLFGKISPSGKLPATFEKQWSDNPVHDSYYTKEGEFGVNYKEGIFVGYRGYEKNNVKPQFPFGYGLSYSKFEYCNLAVKVRYENDKPVVNVAFSVTNVGKMKAAEVAQVYLSWKDAKLPQPTKELKGFEKVDLSAGETKKVSIDIGFDQLASFNTETGKWFIDGRKFEILIGSSSADIKDKKAFSLK